MIIEVKNLVKRYKKAETNAVDDISFSVKAGAFFAFLGPNGAGKTTTVSILTTTLNKTSGTVKIAGFDLDKQENAVRQNIGVIFQNPSLDKNLTAEENVRFHAVLYGLYPYRPMFSMMPQGYQRKVEELAEVLGVKDELFKPIKTFSGGMKRKLEIVRSLIHKPRVLFLDEPTSGLDPMSRKNLWQYLQEVRAKDKTTIFLTTHYLDEAEGADTIAIINQGKMVSYGTPQHIKKDLIDEYLLVDTEDRKALKSELKELHLPYTENEHLKVILKNKKAQEVIKKINTPLSFLRIHTPTLEEAYLEILDSKNE